MFVMKNTFNRLHDACNSDNRDNHKRNKFVQYIVLNTLQVIYKFKKIVDNADKGDISLKDINVCVKLDSAEQ